MERKVMLFEEFSEVNTEEIDKPCVDCEKVTSAIKKEIKRIDSIKSKKKNSNKK